MKPARNIFRWVARSLGVGLLLFWGFFIVAHLAGGNEPAPRPLSARDLGSLTAMLVSLAGLAVAWKRERAGGLITLLAVLVGTLLNWKVLLFPGTLIPVDAVLFLLADWTNRAASRKEPAPRPGGE